MAKFLKDILGEVAQPKAGDEKRFKDKHEVQDTEYPAKDTDVVLNARKAKKDKSRAADTSTQDQEDMYEEHEYQSAVEEIANILSEDDETFNESVVEDITNISLTKKEQFVKLNDGTEIEVDPETAESIVSVLEDLSPENKKTFVDSLQRDEESFLRMVDFAISMREE